MSLGNNRIILVYFRILKVRLKLNRIIIVFNEREGWSVGGVK